MFLRYIDYAFGRIERRLRYCDCCPVRIRIVPKRGFCLATMSCASKMWLGPGSDLDRRANDPNGSFNTYSSREGRSVGLHFWLSRRKEMDSKEPAVRTLPM